MPIMESEWHHRGHPLPESAHLSAQSLPSVAELLSSRPPTNDSGYHRAGESVPPAPVHRPVSRSTPPSAPVRSAVANPPTVAESSSWTAVNHASPHVSPTNTTLPPKHHQYQLSVPQSAAVPLPSALTSEASRCMQGAAHSQPLINSQRQDSAISQQRIETFKEAQSAAPSTESNCSHSYQSPNDNQNSTSPRLNSLPTTSSPPGPATVETSSNQAPSRSGAQYSRRSHSKSRSLSAHIPVDPSRSHEHVASLATPVDFDSGCQSMLPSSTSDQTNNSGTRQQRYNVRFGPSYTSKNMSPSQKPRHDPPAAPAPAPAEIIVPQIAAQDLPVTPSVEPSLPFAIPAAQSTDDLAQRRRRDPSVERCPGCNEAWKRPLPDPDQYRQESPAENNKDMARNSMNMIENLQNHSKRADAMYDRWKWKHSHCHLQQESYNASPPSPPATEPPDDSHSADTNGAPRDSRPPTAQSNKRKSDALHSNERQHNSKSRKVTFQAEPSTAPA